MHQCTVFLPSLLVNRRTASGEALSDNSGAMLATSSERENYSHYKNKQKIVLPVVNSTMLWCKQYSNIHLRTGISIRIFLFQQSYGWPTLPPGRLTIIILLPFLTEAGILLFIQRIKPRIAGIYASRLCLSDKQWKGCWSWASRKCFVTNKIWYQTWRIRLLHLPTSILCYHLVPRALCCIFLGNFSGEHRHVYRFKV